MNGAVDEVVVRVRLVYEKHCQRQKSYETISNTELATKINSHEKIK